LAVCALACGCTGRLPLGAFHEGRYPAAAADLRRIEPELADYAPDERARYALYRGLTHLALGDAVAADRWLTRARRGAQHNPEWFDTREHGQLASAWRSMGRMPGQQR
jgi:hypothetical protein